MRKSSQLHKTNSDAEEGLLIFNVHIDVCQISTGSMDSFFLFTKYMSLLVYLLLSVKLYLSVQLYLGSSILHCRLLITGTNWNHSSATATKLAARQSLVIIWRYVIMASKDCIGVETFQTWQQRNLINFFFLFNISKRKWSRRVQLAQRRRFRSCLT